MEYLWIAFNLFVLVMLALDLGVFHRKAHAVRFKEAMGWSAFWITLALIFNGWVWYQFGDEKALQFLTGYVIEKSLSVDNIFVMAIIFSAFHIPAKYQHKVLFWGILGALVMRAGFIVGGVALLERFHWLIYVFGAFLIVTGIRMLIQKEHHPDPTRNPLVRLASKVMPVTHDMESGKFLSRKGGKLHATPLFLALLTIEFTDLVFAVDSIPAIMAVTPDPFIIYTSNVFAILGLRSLYFALAGMMDQFRYLKTGLAFILGFVGIKMCIMDIYKIPTPLSLAVIVLILVCSVVASLWASKKDSEERLTRSA